MIEPVKFIQNLMPDVKITYAKVIIDNILHDISTHPEKNCYYFEGMLDSDELNKMFLKQKLKRLSSSELLEIRITINNIFYFMGYYLNDNSYNGKNVVEIIEDKDYAEYIQHHIPQECQNDMKRLERQVADEILETPFFQKRIKEKEYDKYIFNIELSIMKLIRNKAYENKSECVYHFHDFEFKPSTSVITQIVQELNENGYHVEFNKRDMTLLIRW